MSEPSDRFLVQTESGTVARLVGTAADASENDDRFSP